MNLCVSVTSPFSLRSLRSRLPRVTVASCESNSSLEIESSEGLALGS